MCTLKLGMKESLYQPNVNFLPYQDFPSAFSSLLISVFTGASLSYEVEHAVKSL